MFRSGFKKYLCESLGTFFLFLMGCGSAILSVHSIGLVGISLSFGIVLLLLVYAFGPLSGCHLNPAVTLCLAFNQKFPRNHVVGYILAQCVGAILGALALYLIAKGNASFDINRGFALNGYGEHSPEHYTMLACLITEVIMTSLLLLVILSTTESYFSKGFEGLAVGLTLCVIHLVTIPITNTSVNIARSLGPAMIYGGWALEQLRFFILAHLISVIIASSLHNIIKKNL
jgi:aquaporin Z